MPISRSLRYQVLRRDNNSCRYCGAKAPEAKLHVDHVTPVTLGGSDSPENLVAACADCNIGKSATPADAAVIEDVEESQIRWSKAMQKASEAALKDLDASKAAQAAISKEFKDYWDIFATSDGSPIPLPLRWEETIAAFVSGGLHMELILDSVDIAMDKQTVRPRDTFKYMCGVAWNRINALQKTARSILDG